MITDSDIIRIIKAQKKTFYTKKEMNARLSNFYIKEEMDDRFYSKPEMDEKFSQVMTAIDGIAKNNLIHDQEMTVLGFRIKRAEEWVEKAAPKIGVEFEY